VASTENGKGKAVDYGRNLATEGKRDALKDVSIEAQLQKESLTMHINGQDKRTVFEPNRIIVQAESGRIVGDRSDSRSTFRGHPQQTPWDDMQLAYFTSYALWNYLTIPFLYTYPGFVTEELAPWKESGEHWRAAPFLLCARCYGSAPLRPGINSQAAAALATDKPAQINIMSRNPDRNASRTASPIAASAVGLTPLGTCRPASLFSPA
jgi:hypothetical protein